MNNDNELFYEDNRKNNFFEFIKETPIYDYMITLDLVKARYSYEDMEKILEEIKSVQLYYFDKNKIEYQVIAHMERELLDELVQLILVLNEKGLLKNIVTNL